MTLPVFSARSCGDGLVTTGPLTYAAGDEHDDGIFARWRWAGARLEIERDRWSVRPLFWAVTPTSVHVSPSVDALLRAGVAADLDEAAIAVFLRIGFFVGDDTPFRSIRAVPAAQRITWTASGVTMSGIWRYPRAADITRPQAIDRFGDCFAASVERRVAAARAPVAVPLSGGHDSRHILLAMCALRRPPDRCVTVQPYRPAAGEDVAIATSVARALGVCHVVLPQRTRRVEAEREKNVLTHYCADEHAQFLPLRDYFAAESCEVFDGLAGDVLSQSQRLDASLHADMVEGRFDRAAERVLGDARAIEPAIAGLLTCGTVARFTRRLALTRLAAEMARHAGAANPIAGFFFFSRMRREIALAPYALLDRCPVSTPFLDAELTELLLSLPFSLVADRRLHTDTLHRRYPRFASLPFDTKQPGTDDAVAARRTAAALLSLVLRARSDVVSTPAVAARLVRAMASGRSSHLWFLPRIVHLLDVERRYTEFTR